MTGKSVRRNKKQQLAAAKKKTQSFSRDITINDFADASSATHVRLKKNNVQGTILDNIEVAESVEEVVKKQSKSKKKDRMNNVVDDAEGNEYPLDLWFLISEHIKPDCVGIFARICKSTYYVTNTGKFWFHLYKRFYRPDANLPPRLRPERMERLHGLRACVIRTLHFTYFNSLEKIEQNPYQTQAEPHSLVNRRCCLMWHEKGESRWYFYFKLKELITRPSCRSNKNTDNFSLLERLEDVSVNDEENCRILRVACLNYGMIPLVNGLILQSVKLTLSPGFGHHRLQLGFGTSYVPKIPTQVVILSGVIDCKVLDWWHPCYPHQEKVFNFILPTSTDSWHSDDDCPNSILFSDEPLNL